MSIELERKFYVSDTEGLVNWLKVNSEFLATVKQEDILFKGCGLDNHNILRFRKQVNSSFITFKRLIFKGDEFLYCEEYESEILSEKLNDVVDVLLKVSDSFNAESLALLSDKLTEDGGFEDYLCGFGFTVEYIINKSRSNYKFKDFLISVDVVKDLGNFVELEYIGENNLDIAMAEMNTISQTMINTFIGDVVNKGYLDLLKENSKNI